MKHILTIFLALCTAKVVGQSAAVLSRIRQVEHNLIPYVPVKGFEGWKLADRMKHYQVPGVSIAVIKDYQLDWAKGYGLADTLRKTPVTTSTMFSAGSISKFLMAVTALKLVEQGNLSLDSPINNYLSSWKLGENDYTKAKPVTLRMLLSHQAGTTQASYFGFTPDKTRLPTAVEILSGAPVAETRAVVVNSEPGKEFRYSGGGSMIAQMALMDVSRQSFDTLTQRLLFKPLGMKNSTFSQPLPVHYNKQAASAYSAAPWFKGMPYVYPQQAAAGLYTTPSDLARFFIDVQLSLVAKGKMLSREMTQAMLTPQVMVSEGSYKEEMGIGPFLIQRTDNASPEGRYFEFTGVNAGFLAYGIGSVTGGNGVIIMLNSGDDVNGLGKEIRRAVAKVYGWTHFLPDEVIPVVLTDKDLSQLVGRYRRSIDEVVSIRREKDYLIESINDGSPIYTFPISRDSMVFTDYNIKGVVRRDAKGEVIGLQTAWQQEMMPKMADDEYSPSEYLKLKRYNEAKAALKAMNLNPSQITYRAYDLIHKKPGDMEGAKAILEVAQEQHPGSSMVYSRWADYYLQLNDREHAIQSLQKALALDPADVQAKGQLQRLLQ